MRRMQRNGLIGQEFVCVKTERWCIGKKTHTQAHAHMHTLKVCSSGSVLLRGTGQPDPESFASRQGIIGFYFQWGISATSQWQATQPHIRTYSTLCTLYQNKYTHGHKRSFFMICFHSIQTNVYLPVFLFCSVFYHPTGQTQMTPHPSTIRQTNSRNISGTSAQLTPSLGCRFDILLHLPSVHPVPSDMQIRTKG